MIYLVLFVEFFKTGLLAIGGGLATLPFLYNMSRQFGWFNTAEIANMLAVAQLVPGAVGINLGCYAGISAAGAAGAFAAPLGMVAPQIAVILLVAALRKRCKHPPRAEAAFDGLKAAACGLLAAAWLLLCREILLAPADAAAAAASILGRVRLREGIVFLVILAAVCAFKKHPAFYIAAAAAAGILLQL